MIALALASAALLLDPAGTGDLRFPGGGIDVAPELTRPPDGRPTEPTRLFNLRLPFKDSPLANRDELSIDLHEGNTWNPTVALEYPGFHPQSPGAPLVPVSRAPPGVKLYAADGVIESEIVRETHRISSTDELEVALNLFRLTQGTSPVDFLASGAFIAWSHTHIFHQNDPDQRALNGLDSRAQIFFHDLRGNTYAIGNGQFFLGTLDLGNTKYVPLVRNFRTQLTLIIGAFSSLPLSSFNSHLSVGASVGLAEAVRIVRGFGFSIAAQISGQDNQFLQLWNGLDYFDQPLEADYRLLFSADYELDGGQRFALGFELQGATAPMSSLPLNAAPVNPAAVGVQTPYNPATKLVDSYRGQLLGSEFISLFLQLRLGRARVAPTIDFYLQEDWTLLFGTQPFLLFRQSNDLQDWGFGVRMREPF